MPYFLIRDHRVTGNPFEHIGSLDIDLVVDPRRISTGRYSTIVGLITDRGWAPTDRSRFTFQRRVRSGSGGIDHEIRVDFLAPDADGPAGRHRHRTLQGDLPARRFRGAGLAIGHARELRLTGELPDGGEAEAAMSMADVVGCVGMKGLALGSRYAEKDAYDLVSVVDNYGHGPMDAARAVRPFVGEEMMRESLEYIRRMFRDERAEGPSWAAGFLTDERDETYRRLVVRSQMVMSSFLEALG